MASKARARSTWAAGALSERLRRVKAIRSSGVSGRRGSFWRRDMVYLDARGSPATIPNLTANDTLVLDAGGVQPGEAVLVDRLLPAPKLVHRQGVSLAGFFEAQKAAPHRRDHLRFAAHDPGGGGRRGRSAIVSGLPSGPMT